MTGERRMSRLRWGLWILILVFIGVAAGAGRIWLSDFTAVNGDFQTYNVLRRFLDGQVPYRDFTNYLGMGVLWLNAPFLLLHNTFTASLFLTNAVTAVLCSVTVWLVLWLMTRRQTLAMAVGALTPFLYRWTLTQESFSLFVPGVSMRMVRGFLPVLLAGLLLLVARKSGWDSLDWFHRRSSMTLCGAALGLLAVWSNDFGYAALGAGMCILLVLTLFRNGKRRPLEKLADYLSFLGSAAAGYLLMVTVITAGSPGSFFSQSAGVAGDQFWYYGMSVNKLFTLKDLLVGSPEGTGQLLISGVALTVFVVLFVLGRLTLRGVAVLFLELTGLFAQLIYVYGSGSHLVDFMRLLHALLLIGLGLRALLFLGERLPEGWLPRWLPAAASGAVMAVLLLGAGWRAAEEVLPLTGPREGTYVAELDGWFTEGEGLRSVAQFLEGERYFSTYASALDTMQGCFQPTGTDYIIHALGAEQREAYLEDFAAGEYPYAVTIRKDYAKSLWEWWVQRANWYFYRELYANYVPVTQNDYALVWERREGGALLESRDYTLTTRRLDDSSVRVEIELGPSLADLELVADVALTYETDHSAPSLHYAVMIEDGTLWGYDGVYYLDESAGQTRIPVIIREGRGSVTVTARPGGRCALQSVTAQVEQLFDQSRMDNAFFG